MSVSLRYNGRLPGVVVNTALPPQPAPLRLDVAGFVGFAERGPLDTPVALEDIGQYQAVFGDDLPVARAGGKPIYAALPSAVRAFFDNGGRRCYAVRVAGTAADQARFLLPGMVALSGAALMPATVEAAWVGRWSEQLALWTQLLVRPLRLMPSPPALDADSSTHTLVLELPRATAIAPGDLLRLTFDNGLLAFFSVDAATALGQLRGIGQGVPVAVRGQSSALWLFRRTLTSTPAITQIERLGSLPQFITIDTALIVIELLGTLPAPLAIDAAKTLIEQTGRLPAPLTLDTIKALVEQLGNPPEPIASDTTTALSKQPNGYALALPAGTNVQAGDLLRISCADGTTLLFPVVRATANTALGPAPSRMIDTISWLTPEPIAIEPATLLIKQAAGYQLTLPSDTVVQTGDLLRIRCVNGATLLFTVADLNQGVAHGQQPQWLTEQDLAAELLVRAVERIEQAIAVEAGTLLIEQPAGYDLTLPARTNVKVGDLLRITCAGGQVLLFPVARVGKLRVSCDEPFWLAHEAIPAAAPRNVELLRFALRVRQGETTRERFEELRFGPGPDDWTQQMCAWSDSSAAGPPLLPAARSALLRVPPLAATPRYLPIGMALLPAADAYSGPYAAGNDGLASFDPWELFLDARLRDFGPRTLMAEAERLLYLNDQPSQLRALHSLIPVEEVALIAMPDLVQRGWPAKTVAPPIDPAPIPPPAPAPPDWSSFQDCARPVPAAITADAVVREFYGNLLPITLGDQSPALEENARALLSETFRAQIALLSLPLVLGVDEPAISFVVSLPPCATETEQTTSVLGVLTLASGVELRTDFGLVRQDTAWKIDSITSRIARTVPSEAQRRLAQLPLLLPPAEYVDPPAANGSDHVLALVRVQAALIALCAARGDITATLSLPDFFEQREAADWRARLESAVGLPTTVALSFAAVYHPWLQQPEPATPELAPLRAVPPEGAICGTIAAREHDRGVWVAPAGIAIRGAVGLTPALTDDEAGALFDAPTQINIVRQQPGRYLAISAHTLSAERIYWQLGVRRLLILLRKAALRRGAQYVFETNNERFQQQVRGSFERMLARLAQQGALAAYQVIADSSLNTPNDRDNGRFLVALKVAPISPIEFITVVLLRSGEDLLDVLER